MKAVCTQYGSPEVLQIQEVEKPTPKRNQILIKIVATAVNSGDVRVRSLDVNGFLKVIMRLVLGISKPRKPIYDKNTPAYNNNNIVCFVNNFI